MSARFRMGEFFSGPGGMALGASQAATDVGVKLVHAWANDIDADTCATYRRNVDVAPENVHCSDVRTLDIGALGEIDGFAFGFPCNDFSTVGENLGLNGRFGPLYQNGVEVLKKKQPRWFVAENVSGLRSSNSGQALPQILNALAETGYRLTPHLYRFEDYGVPQKRHRVIIVGIREDEVERGVRFAIPAPNTVNNHVTVQEALAGIAPNVSHQELTRHSLNVIKRLRAIPEGKNAFNAGLEGELALNVKGVTLSNIYRRLERNKPSYTVTGSGGGGTHIYHWSEDRALTNRERARLQTFPDNFRFHGGVSSVRKQIGMAVPVEGARVIFEALFKSFRSEPYPSVPANIKWTATKLMAPEPV
ncbi:DNA cytosine methyltransferase [Nesterenkonia sandarakina]|uniref:Cytosine-specific methyltransferase n=1 Tax=Nesterenkonia sandarakina TaxID=272918 RepID=A0A7Z0E8P3_9MICC|nr:DNA cytosine methyltransferase [Nesterenkonia sandarakina]NYJ16978.1 DNA (cytosine-5)-methyltransferase 1 [Nesterenkonia sandarakina]